MSRYKTNPNFKPHSFSGLVTLSDTVIRFMEKAARVAKTNASILVRGESGTGKELVARYIHEQSQRAQHTFSAINCAALSRELMASELFGHRKGAFTGATQDRKGLLQLTHGGSLFLDEIAELPLDIQAGLLRVLQDHHYTPLGSSDSLHTDIRLISATHESLRQQVANKTFREDLMYRVRVVPLYLPPLVQRDNDIEMLCWHFIEQFSQQNSRQVTQISADAFDCLMSYRYPGNVRELRNIIEYAHAIGEQQRIEISDLPPELTDSQPLDERADAPEHSEAELIQHLLKQHKGHKQAVADALGISRATLWRKLKTIEKQGL